MWFAIYSNICHENYYIGTRGFWIEAHLLEHFLRKEHELLVFRGSLLSSGLHHGLREHALEPIDKSEWDVNGGDLQCTRYVAVLHHLDLEGALDWVHLLSLDPTIRIILLILPWRLAINFIIIIIIIRRGFSYNKLSRRICYILSLVENNRWFPRPHQSTPSIVLARSVGSSD